MTALEHYLQGLWGGRFRVTFATERLARVTFDERELLLPSGDAESTLDLARAAHVGAHTAFSGAPFVVGSLKPLQRVLVSLFEDARVEALAMRRFPGLRRLWTPFHDVVPTPLPSASALLTRLARALFEPSYADPDAWVTKAQQRFAELALERSTPDHSRALGSVLGNELGQMRLAFDPKSYVVEPAYRDDHAGLWERPPAPAKSAASDAPAPPPAVATHHYPEWDYVIARERPGFCQLSERRAEPAPAELRARAAPGLVQRVRRSVRRLATAEREQRGTSDGPELDLRAAIDTAAAIAAGHSPVLRVYRRPQRRPRPTSALLLLDLSESSRTALPDGSPAFELLERCARALAATSSSTFDLAIDGFSSFGRSDVRYTTFKDFGEPASLVGEKLGALTPGGSTRLGAAIRHAQQRLARRARTHRLLIVVTDADPADIDVYDSEYLLADARAAVTAALGAGIRVAGWCLPSGPTASQRRIFREDRAPLSRLADLPSCLCAAGGRARGRADRS